MAAFSPNWPFTDSFWFKGRFLFKNYKWSFFMIKMLPFFVQFLAVSNSLSSWSCYRQLWQGRGYSRGLGAILQILVCHSFNLRAWNGFPMVSGTDKCNVVLPQHQWMTIRRRWNCTSVAVICGDLSLHVSRYYMWPSQRVIYLRKKCFRHKQALDYYCQTALVP